jgi:hypothetical protein
MGKELCHNFRDKYRCCCAWGIATPIAIPRLAETIVTGSMVRALTVDSAEEVEEAVAGAEVVVEQTPRSAPNARQIADTDRPRS